MEAASTAPPRIRETRHPGHQVRGWWRQTVKPCNFGLLSCTVPAATCEGAHSRQQLQHDGLGGVLHFRLEDTPDWMRGRRKRRLRRRGEEEEEEEDRPC